jgi:hypothetical protein
VKQIAQYQDGRMELQEVPKPTPPPGGVLVRLTHSVISPGTEKMKVEQAKMNLLQKAKARPDQGAQSYRSCQEHGLEERAGESAQSSRIAQSTRIQRGWDCRCSG